MVDTQVFLIVIHLRRRTVDALLPGVAKLVANPSGRENSEMRIVQLLLAGGVLALAAACGGGKGDAAKKDEAAKVGGDLDLAAAAVANNGRPADDRADDENRKPAEVLAFTGIKPGDVVFEMEAGPGYYTELISPIVGLGGKVYMQNPAGFDSFLGDAVPNRLADNRLPNVEYVKSNFDDLVVADSEVDVVTWILGPHELYFLPPGGESLGGVEETYAEIMRILEPGGYFIVLDHAAESGAPETTGNTLHRIDPAIVKGLAADAGFVLVEESDILRNPDDKYDMGVFDPEVRRKTDRFLLKFQKPE